LEGTKGQARADITLLLAQGTKSESAEILAGDTIERLAAGLSTPLQIDQYLTLAFEAAYQGRCLGAEAGTADWGDCRGG